MSSNEQQVERLGAGAGRSFHHMYELLDGDRSQQVVADDRRPSCALPSASFASINAKHLPAA